MTRRANGEGTIRHNPTRNRWEARITTGHKTDGRPIRRMVTARTRREVTQRLRELQAAHDAGQDPAPRDLTVKTFLDQWLDDVLPGTVAPATERQYRQTVRLYITPHIGRKMLRTLTARDVAKMLRTLDQEGRSANTRRLARAILRRALRYAEIEGMVARNVAALADGVKVGRPDNADKALTVDQARTFLDYLRTFENEDGTVGHRLEAVFVVGLSLGLRLGELLGLSWADVDLDGTPARLMIRNTLTRVSGDGLSIGETKTAGSRRSVHLPSPTLEALRRHRTRQLEERLALADVWPATPLGYDLMFRTPLGTPLDPDNFRRECYRLTEAAGIGRRSPHQLRHSAASLLIAAGVPMKIVSETLGHSSIKVTADVYAHLFDEAGAVAADAMTAVLGGVQS